MQNCLVFRSHITTRSLQYFTFVGIFQLAPFVKTVLSEGSYSFKPLFAEFTTNPRAAPSYDYDRFFPASGNSFIRFKVKADSDAMLLITGSGYASTLPYFEVPTYNFIT